MIAARLPFDDGGPLGHLNPALGPSPHAGHAPVLPQEIGDDEVLTQLRPRLDCRVHEQLGVRKGEYALATLHRPSNVDEPAALERLLVALAEVSGRIPVVFPIHPRTRSRLDGDPSLRAKAEGARGLKLVEPIGYLDFLALTANARLVMTDSGGIQEETTALGVPCLTVRHNTERPVTVEVGTNTLVGTDPAQVVPAAVAVLEGRGKKGRVPDLWDGRAAERIARILVRSCEERGR